MSFIFLDPIDFLGIFHKSIKFFDSRRLQVYLSFQVFYASILGLYIILGLGKLLLANAKLLFNV